MDIVDVEAPKDVLAVENDSPVPPDSALQNEVVPEAKHQRERSPEETAALEQIINVLVEDITYESRRSLRNRLQYDEISTGRADLFKATDIWSRLPGPEDLAEDEDFILARTILRRDFEQEMDRLLEKQLIQHNLKKKKEEERLKIEGEEMDKNEDGTGGEDDEGQATDAKSRPRESIKRCTDLVVLPWVIFKKSHSSPDSELWDSTPVVQILEGDPEFKFFRGPVTTASKSETYTGATELPERIRISSEFFMKLFATLGTTSGFVYYVVFTRPFSWLIGNETRLRSFISDLEADIASRSESTPPPAEDANEQNDTPDKEKERKTLLSQGTAHDLEELKVIIKFIDNYIKKREAYLMSLSAKEIYFSDLPLLFKPGDFVISADERQAYQVLGVKFPIHQGGSPWRAVFYREQDKGDRTAVIRCISIDFDGQLIGPVVKDFEVTLFTGTKSLASLPIYHLEFKAQLDSALSTAGQRQPEQSPPAAASGLEKLKESLVERGRVFLSNTIPQHMQYSGPNILTREEIDSRVVIDFEEGFTISPGSEWKKTISAVPSSGFGEDSEGKECQSPCCYDQCVYQPNRADNRWEEYVSDSLAKHAEGTHKTGSSNYLPLNFFPHTVAEVQAAMKDVSDDCLLIMSYRAIGYVLRDRAWAFMDVGLLQKLEAKSHSKKSSARSNAKDAQGKGFHDLVLPKGHEEMVVSLIAQHARNKLLDRKNEEQYDIVHGKGKGLIILLHGAPGVGKTTTAEAAAEKFNKPLLQITCGDLGTTAKEVEEALKSNFNLASRWSSVLLLDEADVFLATRRRDDFSRNALVAVFLRTLEYYSGILFLTTNRVGDFDEAFKSRIHMSLYYPPLTKESAWKIFELNFEIIRTRYGHLNRRIEIDVHNIKAYVGEYWDRNKKARWNGRQIRNACQTALALAEFEALEGYDLDDINATKDAQVRLSYKALETVANAYLEFNKYITKIQGADDGAHAFRRGLRADDTWDEPSDETPKTLLDFTKHPNVQTSSTKSIMQRAGQMEANQAAPSTQNIVSPSPNFAVNYPPDSPVPSVSAPAPAQAQVPGQYYGQGQPTVPPMQYHQATMIAPGANHVQYQPSSTPVAAPAVMMQHTATAMQPSNQDIPQTMPANVQYQAQANLYVPQQSATGYNGGFSSSSQTLQPPPTPGRELTPTPSVAPSVPPSVAQSAVSSVPGRSSAARESPPRMDTGKTSQAGSTASSQDVKKKKKWGLFK